MTVVLCFEHGAVGVSIYTCEECDQRVRVSEPGLPVGWEERQPEIGHNYHVCPTCVRDELASVRTRA